MNRFLGLLVIVLSFLVITPRAFAISWSDNKLDNPGAELGNAIGWITSGQMNAVESQWQSGLTAYPHSGDWFFTAASDAGTYGSLKQQIDLSSFINATNAGDAQYNFSFWYQNEYWYDANHPDTGEGVIKFYGSSMNELINYTSGEISSQDAWALFNHQDYIPKGAETAEVSLWGYLHDGGRVNTHFDDISFRVGVPNVVPEPVSFILFGLGGVTMGISRRLKKRKIKG
jgi:hypothetical protein